MHCPAVRHLLIWLSLERSATLSVALSGLLHLYVACYHAMCTMMEDTALATSTA